MMKCDASEPGLRGRDVTRNVNDRRAFRNSEATAAPGMRPERPFADSSRELAPGEPNVTATCAADAPVSCRRSIAKGRSERWRRNPERHATGSRGFAPCFSSDRDSVLTEPAMTVEIAQREDDPQTAHPARRRGCQATSEEDQADGAVASRRRSEDREPGKHRRRRTPLPRADPLITRGHCRRRKSHSYQSVARVREVVRD